MLPPWLTWRARAAVDPPVWTDTSRTRRARGHTVIVAVFFEDTIKVVVPHTVPYTARNSPITSLRSKQHHRALTVPLSMTRFTVGACLFDGQ
jgi:hypothetical protein